MNRTAMRYLSVLLGLWITVALGASAVRAQDSTPESHDPSDPPVQMSIRGEGLKDGERYVVPANPGDVAPLNIYLGNQGTTDLGVISYTSNLRTKPNNGGLDMGQQGEELTGPPTWVDYPAQEYTLAPGQEIQVPFQLSVPADVEPGEYVIPIAIETLDAYGVAGAGSIEQKIRKVLTIYIAVGSGYTAGFDFGEPEIVFASPSNAGIVVPMTNSGQTSLRLKGQLTLKDSAGNTVVDTQVIMGTFYRKDESALTLRLDSILPAGEYSLTVQLTDTVSGVANGFTDKPVTMPDPPSDEVAPLAFGNVIIAPNDTPIQFASAAIEIVNNADTVRSTRLTLIVNKDGQHLEDFVLSDNMQLSQGSNTVSQRYLPLDGWQSGTYTFGLKLETADPATGAVTLLLSSDSVAEIIVP